MLQSTTPVTPGRMLGTPIVGAVDHFLRRFGPAAGAATIAELPPRWRNLVRPHTRALGLMGSQMYPYAFVGDLVETMSRVVHPPDPNEFIRELASAGIDSAMNTVMRVFLRLAATPSSLAARGQEAWDMFHDSGRVSVVATENEYVATTSNWPAHNVAVCKICMYVRLRIIERTGVKSPTATRDKCQAFGHDSCVVRIRWSA